MKHLLASYYKAILFAFFKNICFENFEEFLKDACCISPTLGDFVSFFYIENIGDSILMQLIF